MFGSLLFLTTGTDKLQEWAKLENQKVAEKELTKEEESGYNTDNNITNNSADQSNPELFTKDNSDTITTQDKDNGDTITSQDSGYSTAIQNSLHNLSNIIQTNDDGETNKTFAGEDVESQVDVQELFTSIDSNEIPTESTENISNIKSTEQIIADHSKDPNESSKLFEATEIIKKENFDDVNRKEFVEIIFADSNDKEKSI